MNPEICGMSHRKYNVWICDYSNLPCWMNERCQAEDTHEFLRSILEQADKTEVEEKGVAK